MKFLFKSITSLSLRFRWLILVLVVLSLALGVLAFSRMNQELLPPISFPQTIVLAQVSGMTSEEVLTVVTERLEAQINEVEDVINIESVTTGAFGATIVAYNDFGLNQDRLRDEILAAINQVWFPRRRIAPAEGQDVQQFATSLLADMTPEVLIYIAEDDPNFLFQLSPEVWSSFPAETVEIALAYLAAQVETTSGGATALERLVDKEIVPQIRAIEDVASVSIDGGQALPGEQDVFGEQVAEIQAVSQLLRLSPEVWQAASAKVPGLGALDEQALSTLSAVEFVIPLLPPPLPESWQMDHFSDANDLLEILTLTEPAAELFNDFYETGTIIGAIGQTDDLTPETVTRLLEIEPSLVHYLEADHLVALSPEVFAVLPDEYIAGLDGFTRDALAAAALAESITGESAERPPVDLPDAWRIAPPQIITFSAADIPLAVFSVSTTGELEPLQLTGVAEELPDTINNEQSSAAAEGLANVVQGLVPVLGSLLSGGNPNAAQLASDSDIALADAWSVLASEPQFVGNPLAMTSDVVELGDGQASSVLNTINAGVPTRFEGYEVRLFDSLTPEMVAYFVEQEPNFYANLDIDVLLKFNAEVLAELPEDILETLDAETAERITAIAGGEEASAFAALRELYTTTIPAADPNAPILNPAWPRIAGFYGIEMDTADDFFRFPEGYIYQDAAAFINSIFDNPQGMSFARNNNLMSDLPIAAVQYILDRDETVLNDLRVEALQLMSEDALALLPETLQQRAAASEQPFKPGNAVTRTNRQPSLFLTVFKDAEANSVTTFHEVDDLLTQLDAQNSSIDIGVVFEQASFVEESIDGVIREGGLGAVFAIIIILIFLSSGVWVIKARRQVGVVMIVAFFAGLIALVAAELGAANNNWGEAFAQSDVVLRILLIFGILAGFVVLFWPGRLPDPAWRSTVVIGVSIPLSIMTAFVLMYWLSPAMYDLIQPLSETSDFWAFILRLFPEDLTLNIMTLSGLTVAVGRVVDDSIVVLENIFRQIQGGGDKLEAVIYGTRDVSAAIFTATLVAVVVFLPLGLTGGLIGAFFLPFGLALTYALAASFVVAIMVVPVLAFLMIDEDDVPEEGDIWLARYYLPVLKWALSSGRAKLVVVALAVLSMFFGFYLFSQRPFAFLPNFGEPQISVVVSLPPSTSIIETDEKVEQLERFIADAVPEDRLTALQTTVGSSGTGFEALFGGGGVTENAAQVIVGLEVSERELESWTQTIRNEAYTIFGSEEFVTVSAASVADGGFGGFSLIVAGPVEELREIDPIVIEALNEIEGITNVTSNFSEAASDTGGGPITYIRVNLESAISYSAELETDNTIGVTQDAITKIQALPEVSENITVSQGFLSETQTQGFLSLFTAMGIASVIVILILIFTQASPVYWLAIFTSVIVAPVGAAIALTVTDRVLGISSLIGLLMLLGLVITNAVVLIDRVQSNLSERGMVLYDALVEAGGRRLRPILMTSLVTIIALLPLAIGLSEGAIIAAEMGTVVIGGVLSSTLLTLIVVPVMYSLLYPAHRFLVGLVGIKAA